jgi:hypothetical protein
MNKAEQCIDCIRRQEKIKMVQLVSGEKVCNYCVLWRIECEARHLLRMPLNQRREELDARVNKRGQKSVNELKAVMAEIHAQKTLLRNSKQR